MNLVDQLLKADIKKADELETGIYHSKKLAKLIGSEAPVDVQIREVKSRRLNDIVAYQFDKNGKTNFSKTYDTKLMLCLEGVVDPPLKDKTLQEHFECDNAKDLCEKLFGYEVNGLSEEISKLSGVINDEDIDEEIKN